MGDWLPGVVAAEMPALFESEALKAQAVAARTYIMNRAAAHPTAHPDAAVCNDPACCKAHADETALRERWAGDFDANMAKMLAAVRDTDGQYLAWEGEPIQAVFHAASAGKTEDAAAIWSAAPYLVSVSSPETAKDVPGYVTTAIFSPEEFRGIIEKAHPDCDFTGEPAYWLGGMSRTEGDRVREAVIGGVPISGAELRELFALRSAAFSLDYAEGSFLFVVTGYGHGVGMSQYGANVMAKGGADYAEILAHYYPGAELIIK